MASASFDEKIEEKKPTVQVGDPFTEKLLLEACLELMSGDSIIAIQDMGAAGLTSSAFEMASKGGVGVELNLDNVPQREIGMSPYEMMLSESQERMLMVIEPSIEKEAEKIFEKWELDFAVIGILTNTKNMKLTHKGITVADLPIDPLALASPEYDRPWQPTPKPKKIANKKLMSSPHLLPTLEALLVHPNVSSKRWIWEQYDYMVMGDTIEPPGGDAGLVRVHGTNKALAVTTDCTPRYVFADPVNGARQAVAEAWRNLICVGSQPLAITDNLNFGNPEQPSIMGQFVGAIEGISDACRELEFPVVSGNVSFYNETDGRAILPTPVIGAVGLLVDHRLHVNHAFKREDEAIIVVGDTYGHLGASLWMQVVKGSPGGPPPTVNLAAEKRNGEFIIEEIQAKRLTACHDVSDGGILVTVTEMAIAGGIGAELAPISVDFLHSWGFGEDQARYIVTTKDPNALLNRASNRGIQATYIGVTGGDLMVLPTKEQQKISILKDLNESWLPKLMKS